MDQPNQTTNLRISIPDNADATLREALQRIDDVVYQYIVNLQHRADILESMVSELQNEQR